MRKALRNTYYLLTAFIDALCLAIQNLVNSNNFNQGNAAIDVCVYMYAST